MQTGQRFSILIFFAAAMLAAGLPARAADYQYGFVVAKPASDPNIGSATNAFLWVPPRAKHLRAVILAPANIIEREFSDSPVVRSMAEREGVAIMFFQAGWSKVMPDAGYAAYIQDLMSRFADISGNKELRAIPWIPIGHSGNSQFVAKLGRGAPDRIACTVVIKGALQQPEKGSTVGLSGVPMLVIHGEFEEIGAKVIRNQWWDDFLTHFDTLRAAVPHALASGVLDRDYGHIWWSTELSNYTDNFIHDSLAARLPSESAADTQPMLRPVSWESGWLVDRSEEHPAAPVASYTGDPTKAFWVFDEAMAKENQAFFEHDQGKKAQMLAFQQDGQIAPWWNGWGVQALKFEPEPDGDTFKVHAVFRDTIPAPIPDAGQALGHADPAGIMYKIVGWAGQCEQTAPDTFAVRFDREGVNGRTVHVLVGAIHPGDATYRGTMCAASMDVPYGNKGAAQKIDFPEIATVSADASTVPLKATVNSPLPVHYYVSWGPAEVEGDSLRLVDIPANAKFPIEVKVTAYQWGKADTFASATPVVRTFHITE